MASLGPVLVAASGIGPGDRVLDVAAGTGNAAISAALAGATVVASDLTPELPECGRSIADGRGVAVTWQQAVGGLHRRHVRGDEVFRARPAPGVSPPPLWGNEDHVRSLLGDRICDANTQRGMLPVSVFGAGEAFRDYFKANYGPTATAYRGIAGDPERVTELDSRLAELASQALDYSSTMGWEYLLLTARRS